tara:strand:- start:2737 stop:5073 length:2337 start_codon:yes stop_codon:yes gene_type:complete
MTDSFGTFDPVKTEDYTAPLLESYKDLNAGMDNYWTQELANYKYKARDAGIKDIEALTNLSTAIGKKITEREERKRQENITKGMLWLKENPLDVLTTEKFEAEINRLKKEGKSIDEFVANYEKKKDSDIWTSESFRNLNSAQKYGAVVQWVEGKVRDYDPSNNEKMQNAVTPEEYKAAEYAASLDLYKTLGDLNPALVQKHVIKKQKELEAAAYSKWHQKRTKEIKAERQKIARSQLISCHENGQGGCAVAYLNERAPYIGNTAAKQELMSQYLAMAKNGDLTSNKILDLEEKSTANMMISSADGKEYQWNEFFAEDWKKIKNAAIAAEAQEMELKQKEKNSAAFLEVNELLSTLDKDPKTGGFTEESMAVLREKQSEFITNGVTGTAITNLNNILTKDRGSSSAIRDADLKAKALIEAEQGILTTERLQTYPLELRFDSDLVKFAKANDPVNALRKENEEAIAKDINNTITTDSSGTATADEIKLVGYFKREYNSLVKFYRSIGDENPENTAYLEVKNKIQEAKTLDQDRDPSNDTFFVRGKWVFNKPQSFSKTAIDAHKKELETKLQNIQKIAKDSGGLSFLDTQQLFPANILKEWSDGKRIPPFAVNIADGLNKLGYRNEDGSLVTGYDVMKRQDAIENRDALNEGKSEDDPSYVKAFKELTPKAQKLCSENQSTNCTTRALATTGVENISFIPDDQGEILKSFAEENGTSFGEYAAALETIPMLNIDYEGDDPFSSMDEFDWLQYNKAVVKYSGGTDKEALKRTIRKDFLPYIK